MPIAHVILRQDCPEGRGDVIALWSQASEQAEEHMTINFLRSEQQCGTGSKAMATLLLPSLWSLPNRVRLQEGLAKALAQYFQLSIDQVHVVSHVLESGCVVENGTTLTW